MTAAQDMTGKPAIGRAAAVLAVLTLAAWTGAALAQSGGGSLKGKHDALSKAASQSTAIDPDAATSIMRGANHGAMADNAAADFRARRWAEAFENARTACESPYRVRAASRALGCNIFGQLLADGRAGPANPTGAATAHRRAAAAYAEACPSNHRDNPVPCSSAGAFFQSAVPAVRNPGLSSQYFARALRLARPGCTGSETQYCETLAMLLADGRGTAPDPRGALAAYQRACEAIPVNNRNPSTQSFIRLTPGPCEAGVTFAARAGVAASNPASARALALAQCNVMVPGLARNTNLYYLAPACGLAGRLTHDGQGGPADTRVGVQLVRLGCGQGDQPSCDWLQAKGLADPMADIGVMLNQRINGLHDTVLDRAEPLCDGGNAVACNQVGVVFGRQAMRGGDAAKVRELREKAVRYQSIACAAPDIPVACDNLGRMQQDLGGAANLAAARVSFDKACAGGIVDGCFRQALMLANGRGGPRDEAKARTLYGRACDANSAAACNNLGYLWKDGRGGALDETRALALFEKACDIRAFNGCGPAGNLLIASTSLPRDPVRGRSLQKRGCDGGSTFACISYAESLRDGVGGPVDAATARGLFDRNCKLETNERNCGGAVADMFWEGMGGPADRKIATQVRQLLCGQHKHAPSCDWLRGKGLPTAPTAS